VNLERAAWWSVIVICAVAVVMLLIEGYSGYAAVVGAVGVSAAVNLF
jgi:ABC-type transporter Mla maintaining outer membrane lipid asymmetry permease subunit MlaE